MKTDEIIEGEFKGKVIFQRSEEKSSFQCGCYGCKKHGGEHVFSSYIDGDFRKEGFITNLLKNFSDSYGDYEGKQIIMKVIIGEEKALAMKEENSKNLSNTNQVELCDKCFCMTYTLMDENGNRFCGKCKKDKKKNQSQEIRSPKPNAKDNSNEPDSLKSQERLSEKVNAIRDFWIKEKDRWKVKGK